MIPPGARELSALRVSENRLTAAHAIDYLICHAEIKIRYTEI